MPKSEKKPLLRITSDDSGVLITVLDRKFATIGEGAGKVAMEVTPGIYGVRFEAGNSVREQLVSVPADKPVYPVHEEQIAFSTSAPLQNTRSEDAEHSRAARRLSEKITRRVGSGGKLMIFVRDHDQRGRTLPTQGLTLHGPAEETFDVAADSLWSAPGETGAPPWAGCNYGVDPGIWTIRLQGPSGGTVEQSLVVCRRWQTQLFLQRGVSRSGRSRSPDLANGAVLMSRSGTPFNPSGEDLRSAELARQGLRDRRAAIDTDELEEWLAGKPRNPMLAVYGAHLLLRQRSPGKSFIARVVSNLREVIGPHPDVRALELWLGDDDGEDFAEPPMLKSSWAILIRASAKRPELVPRGSRSAAIADTVLPGGPWLRWRSPATAALEPPVAPARRPLARAIAELAAALPDDRYEVLAEVREATPSKASVIALAYQAGQQIAQADDGQILASLRVPRSVAEDTVDAVLNDLAD